jgi:CRP-like cAMP-binding protein
VTNDGENPLDLGVDDDDDDENRRKSPRVSLDVSDRDVADSISYERVRGFFDESVAVVRTFKRGEFLIKQGEKGDEMFVILSGEVEVVTLRGGGVGAGGAGDDDRDDEVDMSDDILAAAMMNREFEEEEDDDDEDATATKGDTRPGWLACCFGGSTRAAGRSGPPSLGDPDRLEVVHRSAPSAHALIATRRAGDVVGEMSLLTAGASSARSASVRASSQEVRCSVISKEELWRSLRERPEVLEELRLRSVGRESELIVGRALLRTGSAATMSPGAAEARRGESSHPRE